MVMSADGRVRPEGIESSGTWAGLHVRTVGERRHPKQVVILLHGLGAHGDDLVPLGEVSAAPGHLLAFPAGPLLGPKAAGAGGIWI